VDPNNRRTGQRFQFTWVGPGRATNRTWAKALTFNPRRSGFRVSESPSLRHSHRTGLRTIQVDRCSIRRRLRPLCRAEEHGVGIETKNECRSCCKSRR
jgi:hypothetical protein